jgi:hypothetical protein
MDDWQNQRLTDAELQAFFDQLFPDGLAGADVLGDIAPEGWEQSPLLACFHPSLEQVLEERIQFHRNLESLGGALSRRDDTVKAAGPPLPEPTLEDVRREYQPQPVRQNEELTELVGQCLWDIFSDNHDVVAADGRVADIGSFRGASAFLDEYVSHNSCGAWREGDYMRFYVGTIWISARADLMPVYTMIFRRLRSIGADWIYHFPELHLVDLGALRAETEQPTRYSPSEGAAAELKARKRDAEVKRCRAELAASNARAREEAVDRPPPTTVRAYRDVYGRDPRGWPPC